MSKQSIDSGKNNEKRDSDFAAAEIAMKRAAEKARQRAEQMGMGIAVWKDGRVVWDRTGGFTSLDQPTARISAE